MESGHDGPLMEHATVPTENKNKSSSSSSSSSGGGGTRTQANLCTYLVVLGQTLRPAWRASLDLSRAQTHREVGDVVVFCLPRSVRGHDAPPVLLGQLNGGDGLRNGPDLVHLGVVRVGNEPVTKKQREGEGVGGRERVRSFSRAVELFF